MSHVPAATRALRVLRPLHRRLIARRQAKPVVVTVDLFLSIRLVVQDQDSDRNSGDSGESGQKQSGGEERATEQEGYRPSG